MQNTAVEKNQETNLSLNVEKYPPVELTRRFSAPVENLWEAWTTPDLMKEWWGPETYTCPYAKMDVREGGKSILAMQDSRGKVQYGGGTYLEVIPYKKIVTTDLFMKEDGTPMSAAEAGMPGDWPKASKITIEFKELSANETELSICHEGIPKLAHDDCVEGWSSSLNKLQRLVEYI